MTNFCKRMNILCGHYGTGKTNAAVNLAILLKKQGKDVTLVDLDIVNPYFRSADFSAALSEHGIHTINPMYANSNLDIPALGADIYSVFQKDGRTIVMDVGGDDAGAAALGRYARMVEEQGDYAFFYVINRFRSLIATPAQTAENLQEVEKAARLKATGIFNNSNLSYETTAEDIFSSLLYARQTAQLCGVPLCATLFDRRLEPQIMAQGGIEDAWPVDVFVKPPWEEKTKISW